MISFFVDNYSSGCARDIRGPLPTLDAARALCTGEVVRVKPRESVLDHLQREGGKAQLVEAWAKSEDSEDYQVIYSVSVSITSLHLDALTGSIDIDLADGSRLKATRAHAYSAQLNGDILAGAGTWGDCIVGPVLAREAQSVQSLCGSQDQLDAVCFVLNFGRLRDALLMHLQMAQTGTHFRCPKCGGTHFGRDVENVTTCELGLVRCHTRGCGWTGQASECGLEVAL